MYLHNQIVISLLHYGRVFPYATTAPKIMTNNDIMEITLSVQKLTLSFQKERDWEEKGTIKLSDECAIIWDKILM
jgi:hypothetical protein